MSTYVNFSGIIEYKETPKTYPTSDLLKYAPTLDTQVDGNIFRIKPNYGACGITEYVSNYLQDNIKNIKGAYVILGNDTDDLVPFEEVLEIWDGKYYQQTVNKHVPADWLDHVAELIPVEDDEQFFKDIPTEMDFSEDA